MELRKVLNMKYFLLLALSVFWGVGPCDASIIMQRISPIEIIEDTMVDYIQDLQNGKRKFFGLRCSCPECSLLASGICQNKEWSSRDHLIAGATSLGLDQCVIAADECPNVNVTFWYYSRDTADKPVELKISDPETFNALPKNDLPWKVIIHGYTKSKDVIPNPELREAYFKKGEYNVISVDYEPLARDPCYIHAVLNTPVVAKCTAQMIDALIEKGYVATRNLHLIGFSMGAQVAGTIHEYLKGGVPNRTTGLDPAGPLYDGVVNHIMSKKSGRFVDVIHTNALGLGIYRELGHVDVFLNGGFNQPGCNPYQNGSSCSCSHQMAPLVFAESINSDVGFWGMPCTTIIKFYSGGCNTKESELVQMGEDVPHTARGRFYLETNGNSPFAMGKKTEASVLSKFDFGV